MLQAIAENTRKSFVVKRDHPLSTTHVPVYTLVKDSGEARDFFRFKQQRYDYPFVCYRFDTGSTINNGVLNEQM